MKTVLFLVVGLMLNVAAHAEVGPMDKAKCKDLAEKVKALKTQSGGSGTTQPEDTTNSGDTTRVN